MRRLLCALLHRAHREPLLTCSDREASSRVWCGRCQRTWQPVPWPDAAKI